MIVHKKHTNYNLLDILKKSISKEYWVRLRSMIIIDDV